MWHWLRALSHAAFDGIVHCIRCRVCLIHVSMRGVRYRSWQSLVATCDHCIPQLFWPNVRKWYDWKWYDVLAWRVGAIGNLVHFNAGMTSIQRLIACTAFDHPFALLLIHCSSDFSIKCMIYSSAVWPCQRLSTLSSLTIWSMD